MNIKDLALGTDSELLFICGVDDAKNGVDKSVGWQEICKDLGFTPHVRTPARERYEDGWYSVPSDQRKG